MITKKELFSPPLPLLTPYTALQGRIHICKAPEKWLVDDVLLRWERTNPSAFGLLETSLLSLQKGRVEEEKFFLYRPRFFGWSIIRLT